MVQPLDTRLLVAIDDYVEERFAREDSALQAARSDARAAGLPDISVSPVEGRLLQVLVGLAGARRILEIGTLGGYSAIWMARALPADGRLVSLEIDPHHAAVAARSIARAGLAARVEVRIGRGLDLLAAMSAAGAAEPPFDAAFIDADKPAYPEYLDACLRLVRPGGLILADNVIRGGTVLDPVAEDARAIALFNDRIAGDPRLAGVIVPVMREGLDGLAIVRVLAA